ncbi:hypothetical protein [Pyrobaculum neutrophilum]|uniref:Uncharacterized protein n=1 Tax=Pyrobaculum neutrophilum (strain DSM 2338 / JCM 9278 / NBRC 100436 / V24Sta) TaxID=444157 RepID=B1YB78_PYRNV|nr:hypothetical protein [Pyrobaculum neutrophilum]ACB39209.1 hypothetical protein Tneu_0256 [Pyrobaculum neutrophilum V24Sta]
MSLKRFIQSLDPTISCFLIYRLRRAGYDLEELDEERLFEAVARAAGPHIAEVLYTMYLSARSEEGVLAVAEV